MGWASRQKRQHGRDSEARHPRLVSRRPKEDLRVSERLADLIAPYREDACTLDRYERLLGVAVAAWNLSLLPEAERPEALRQSFRREKVRHWEGVAEVIGTLMRRKEQLFPDDPRTILSWEVSDSGGEFHLSVASLVE